MEVYQVPRNIKILGFSLLGLVIAGLLITLLLRLNDTEYQIQWLQYFWNLSLYSCFMVIVINKSLDKSRKKILFIFLFGTILLSYFMLPQLSSGNIMLTSMTIMMLLYNIIFISILWAISKINFDCLFIFLVNLIVIVGLLASIYIISSILIISHSTTLTYIFGLFFIIYIVITMKFDLFHNSNLYILFILIGNITTIFLYFFILLFHINNIVILNEGLIIFISSLQPLFYWLGINFILMEE